MAWVQRFFCGQLTSPADPTRHESDCSDAKRRLERCLAHVGPAYALVPLSEEDDSPWCARASAFSTSKTCITSDRSFSKPSRRPNSPRATLMSNPSPFDELPLLRS